MKFEEAAQLFGRLPNEQSILVLGPPGIGKTALARYVGEKMQETGQPKPIIEVRDLCAHLPEDLLGLPFREGNATQYCPPTWFHRLTKPEVGGVLVLDDLAAASPAVQVAAFRLVLERRSGDFSLSPGVKIIATANRREDKSGATMLPAALRNRCLISTLEVDVEQWCQWAVDTGLPGAVPAFIRYRPGHLSKLPKDADEELGSFATPRTWEMVARALDGAKGPNGQDHTSIFNMAKGLVGQGIATEFGAFMKYRAEIPNPREVLRDPEKAIPTPPSDADRLVAISTAVAEVAARLSVGAEKENGGLKAADIPALFLAALCHMTKKAGREYSSSAILTYSMHKGNSNGLVAAARTSKNDPRYAELLTHLRSALMPNGVSV